MEPRCFDCICAMCADEATCKMKGCYGDESRDLFECKDGRSSCPLDDDPEDYE